MTEPIVKWAGGKRRMLDRLVPAILERRSPSGVYVELFLGGAAVALSMPRGIDVVGVDVCEPLINTYRTVIEYPHEVTQLLNSMIAEHCRETYYAVRDQSPVLGIVAAARFLYLNKTCFNGLYRVGPRGFNVPIGRRRGGYPPVPPTLLYEFSKRARSWHLTCGGNFESALELASSGDVVFADPPYDGTFGYSSDFGSEGQERLSTSLRSAAMRGVGVVATNADTPMIRHLYRWCRVTEIIESRAVGATTRAPAPCLMMVYP